MALSTRTNNRTVSFDALKASHAKLRSLHPGLTALFGRCRATSGIGDSTMKEYSKHTEKPRVYFVGRNQDAGSRIVSELKALQPNGQFSFIQMDVSTLKNVDEGWYDGLIGTLETSAADSCAETSEGLDRKLATNYYSRLRFTTQLLSLLHAASPQLTRVVSVPAAGEESSNLDLDDLSLKDHFSLKNAGNHASTKTDFAFEALAKRSPSISFVHTNPGLVKIGFFKEQSLWVRAGASALTVLLSPWTLSFEESDQRHLYAATINKYAGLEGKEKGVDIGDKEVCKGIDGQLGSGAYPLGWGGTFRANEKALVSLKEKSAGPKIWEHTMETFHCIRGEAS